MARRPSLGSWRLGRSARGLWLVATGRAPVAIICQRGQQAIAMARLISAAPDMLAALTAFLATPSAGPRYVERLEYARRLARSALLKAGAALP